eukprot:324182-Amphidinium_carterae.3
MSEKLYTRRLIGNVMNSDVSAPRQPAWNQCSVRSDLLEVLLSVQTKTLRGPCHDEDDDKRQTTQEDVKSMKSRQPLWTF